MNVYASDIFVLDIIEFNTVLSPKTSFTLLHASALPFIPNILFPLIILAGTRLASPFIVCTSVKYLPGPI